MQILPVACALIQCLSDHRVNTKIGVMCKDGINYNHVYTAVGLVKQPMGIKLE